MNELMTFLMNGWQIVTYEMRTFGIKVWIQSFDFGPLPARITLYI